MNHSFDVETANRIGVNNAIMLQHIVFWIQKNRANKKHLHKKRTWTYSSVEAFQEIFPYWTINQIRYILDQLQKRKLLIKGNYNKAKYDRTNWYALQNESIFFKTICENDRFHLVKSPNGNGKSPKPIPDVNTDVNTDNKNIVPKNGTIWKEATPMDLKQFVKWCRKSKDAHVQIIGEWADELKQSFNFTGYESYGEWYRLFFKQNLKAARDLTPSWKQENGRTRMSEATALLVSESKNGHWKTGNLSTLIKYMSKV